MIRILLVALLLFLTACDGPVRTMGPTEYGVKFRKFPVALGGGVEAKVSPPGQMLLVFPWEDLYVINTAVQEVSWGGKGKQFAELLNTRARDGNEVALAVTVRYQISDRPEHLAKIISEVAADNKGIEEVVISVARAQIRHYINELRTAEFINPEERNKTLTKVRDTLRQSLAKYYIDVLAIGLDDFRFERLLEDGQKDDTYQDRLDEVQRLVQERAREISRVDTVVAQKSQKLNEVQAQVNRLLQEAKGYSDQARIRGDNYLKAKANDAKSIRAKGFAEVEGLVEQIRALAGQGGKALLRLDVAEELSRSKGNFAVMNQGGNSLSVNKTDTNELLNTLGVVEAVKEKEKIKDEKAK